MSLNQKLNNDTYVNNISCVVVSIYSSDYRSNYIRDGLLLQCNIKTIIFHYCITKIPLAINPCCICRMRKIKLKMIESSLTLQSKQNYQCNNNVGVVCN